MSISHQISFFFWFCLFEAGLLILGSRYVVLTSDAFHHRIDALNHFLEGVYRAFLERLVFDNKNTAMIKTITFSANAAELKDFMSRLEGDLRRDLANLEEKAQFSGDDGERFTMSVTLAPTEERT